MDHAIGGTETALSDAERVQVERVLVELELGLTFLDIAANNGEAKTNRRCVRNAIVALRTANTFLAVPRRKAEGQYIRQRRDELSERLEEALREKDLYT
jgi:hypothetical protein